MKKYIFFLLIALMVSNRAMPVLIDGLYYQLNDEYNTAEVMQGGAHYGAITIPPYVTYNEKQYSVTSIGYRAFESCWDMTSITIGDRVDSIGDRAFFKCTGLTSVEIPNSVTSIGNQAFSQCPGLTSVTIGNSVTSIGWQAFSLCTSLTSISTLGNSIKSIGSSAFSWCTSLTSITIGNSIKSIGNNAFYNCTSLPVFDNIRYADTYLIEAVDKSLSTYAIREGTKWIGTSAFKGCTGLTSFEIPNSVSGIGSSAFNGCTGLTSIEIPQSITSIGDSAFSYCSFTTITIPSDVASIGRAFAGCTNLTTVTVLSNALVSKNYTYMTGLGYFLGMQVQEYILGENVTSIGDYVFYHCTNLTSINIPNNVTSIGEAAFCGCTGLTSLTIPNSVTSIGVYTFSGCKGLKSVIIPNSVTSIGRDAFEYCTGLTTVTCEAITPPSLEYNVFHQVPCHKIPLYVPAESVNVYKNADQWKEFNPILPIGFVGYTITFENWDGNELLKLTGVEHGTMPVYTGNTPTRPDDAFYTYTFKGWSPNIVKATEDATYVAVYDEHPRTTDIKEVSAKTDVIKSLRDGKLVIERGGKTYSVTGQEER